MDLDPSGQRPVLCHARRFGAKVSDMAAGDQRDAVEHTRKVWRDRKRAQLNGEAQGVEPKRFGIHPPEPIQARAHGCYPIVAKSEQAWVATARADRRRTPVRTENHVREIALESRQRARRSPCLRHELTLRNLVRRIANEG